MLFCFDSAFAFLGPLFCIVQDGSQGSGGGDGVKRVWGEIAGIWGVLDRWRRKLVQ